MSFNSGSPWELLFPPPRNGAGDGPREFRLVLKHGEPLLLLPRQRRAIHNALALYPAQTLAARFARSLLATAQRFRLCAGTKPAHLFLNPQAPFTRFLATSGELDFAMLLGNPRAPGRRFVLLVFDDRGQPQRLVKAGVGEAATALIRREAKFLNSAPRDLLHAPALTGEFASGGIEALALEYCPGANPRATDEAPLARLLESWLDPRRTVRFYELPAAQRLVAQAPADATLRRVLADFETASFHPAFFHGDFTPWNVRVRPADGRWAVFDWERGEAAGPPAWDWFHFAIQHEILVRQTSPQHAARRVEEMTHSPAFQRYAAASAITPCVRPLLLAYLLYCCHAQRQTEGMGRIEALLQHLQTS